MLYAIILPIIEIFVGAYIMRNTNDPAIVAGYQLCMYIGIVLTSMLNVLLMSKFKSKGFYAFGILVSAAVLAGTMFMPEPTLWLLCLSGLILGAATGFFWTNRYLLTLNATNDDNRNYFFGLESFFFSLWSIIVPLIVGALLAGIQGVKILDMVLDIKNGYQIVTIVTLLIAICACLVLSKGKFENPPQKKFLYLKFHSLWNKLLTLAGLKGMVQGFLVTAPAILIMKFVGNEGSLGLIQGVAGGITAILVYILGRTTKPKHRMIVFGIGLFVFFTGTLFNGFGIIFNDAVSGVSMAFYGVILFLLCKVLFQPIHDLAYFPTMMRTIDVVSAIEKRNNYAYIMSHELGLFAGRFIGMALFIILAKCVSEMFALKYALIIVAAIQLLSLPLAKHIVKQCNIISK
jgi:YQGE family putative transporter